MPRPPRSRRHRASAEAGDAGRQAASDVRRLRLWRRKLEGWLGFLEEMKAGDPKVNAHWRLQMREHYTAQISRALEIVPTGGERSARDFGDRLRALLRDA